MTMRPKLILAITCFLMAAFQIARHIGEYKRDENPTGLKLVSATLNIISGVLALASDALEQKRLETADSRSAPDEFDEETSDDDCDCR